MFKTEMEPKAAGEWFHCKVFNIFYSVILWSTKVQTMENVVDLLNTDC